MAEGGDAEWELSKENIQPLRRGRDFSALHQALSQQDGCSSTAGQQRQAFESELLTYDGDDPLSVWDRYVRWTEQTFPQGGKESSLATLLERAVTRFAQDGRYHGDQRYLDLCIKFAKSCAEPLDVFRYLQAQQIGVTQASLYISWSEEHENQGNYRQADLIYQEGVRRNAEPRDKLLHFHRALQARASRHAMAAMEGRSSEEEAEPPQQERVSLADLKHRGKKKTVAPVNRTGAAIRGVGGGLRTLAAAPTLGHAPNSRLVVFDENRAEAGPSQPRAESWMAPPTSRAKENEQKAEKWCDVKMPQKTKFGRAVMAPPPPKPSFQPFVEESDEPPAVTPCKLHPAVTSVLSARKSSRAETPLKRLQELQQKGAESEQGAGPERSMYCRELLLGGATEFSFEELKAELYYKKQARQQQEVKGQPDPPTTQQ